VSYATHTVYKAVTGGVVILKN